MPTSQPSLHDRTLSPTQRRRRTLGVVVATAGLALLAAGCGSSSPPSSTSSSDAGAPSQKSVVASAFRYSRCMRTHGVTNFPDPKVTTSPGHSSVGIAAVGPPSPAMNAAQKACQGIMPQGGPSPAQQGQQDRVHRQALLAFARCLRGHGVPGFPDPTTQGDLTPQMLSSAGVDLKAPAFLHEALACVGVTHGAITPAQVAQAVKRLQ
jgi:hypothetical protein